MGADPDSIEEIKVFFVKFSADIETARLDLRTHFLYGLRSDIFFAGSSSSVSTSSPLKRL